MKLFLLGMVLLYSTSTIAQRKMNLSECIAYTLDMHPSQQIYKNNQALSKQQARQHLAEYQPEITGTGTSTKNLKLQSTILTSSLLGPDPAVITIGSKYNTTMGLTLNQTIYDQSKLVGIKANKTYEEQSDLQLLKNNETLTYNTANAYLQVLIIKEQIKILEINQNKYQELLKIIQYQYQKGTVLEKDVDRIQVQLNSTNYQLTDANNNLIQTYNTLKSAIGLPLDSSITIMDSINYKGIENTDQNDFSLENIPDYKLDVNAIALQEFSLKSQKASYLPTLSLVGTYGKQNQTNAYSDIFNIWRGYSYIGLSLNVPIFGGFKKRSLVAQESLKLENQKLNTQIDAKNLTLSYKNFQTARSVAISNYKSNKENMALAQKVVLITNYQYSHGTANLTDYLNDDASYKTSQSDYLISLYNLLISELNYQKSKGTLKEFINQIQL